MALLYPVLLAAAALVVFASGFWLTRAGPPYGAALVNAHKLVDLMALVLLGVLLYKANGAAALSSVQWGLAASTAVLAIVTLATGGVVSAMAEPAPWVLWAHRVVPFPAGVMALVLVVVVSR